MNEQPDVGLFITCLVNVMRPSIAHASIKLLEEAGCRVRVPLDQTCCGQPAFNSGDTPDTLKIAKHFIGLFEQFDYMVVPSGSCAAMVKKDYPALFEKDAVWSQRAKALAAKTFEIMSFLTDIRGFLPKRNFQAKITYHDSCSGLRSLGVLNQPRQLLGAMPGIDFVPLAGNEICCGFGGTFCVKYPDISNKIVNEKAEAIEATGADILLGGDLGCLLNMAGKLKRRGSRVRSFHTVEILAGMGSGKAIGEEL